MKIAILGAGAAGFFSAINIKEFFPKHEVDILEKSDKVLRKVRISGGGRCNVTHSCFQVEDLIKNYPRGQKELRSAFHIFQPENTIQWFAKRGVKLHTEEDGRMFPVSNSSETIVNCFLEEIKKKQINLLTEMKLQGIFREGDSFLLQSEEGFQKKYDRVLFATGSDRTSWKWLTALGHSIIEPIPSLFSFHIHDESLQSLQGLSIDKLSLSLEEKKYRQSGSLLFTHEGLSGPAVLKLSSFAAPYFHD
ncbi:MAG: aminoacetone oxidase family FAD-binding enzyme, partial [Leptospiraceae bacterium]|nr:aminoacetone oxidase family FAD-binding enzyme [Leptospiraceae bacterium]